MKYTVHLYVPVRVRLDAIEADSQEQAVKKACAAFDPHSVFPADGAANGPVFDEAFLGATVDEEGDEEHERSRYHYIGKGC